MAHVELQQLVKRPAEKRDLTVDFTNALPTGVAVSTFVTGYPKATKVSDGSDATSAVIDTGSTISSPNATVKLMAGTDQEDYKIHVRVNFGNGEIVEHVVLMRVEEA